MISFRVGAARTLAPATALLALPALLGLAGNATATTAGTACTPNEVEHRVKAARFDVTITHAVRARAPANKARTVDGPVPMIRVITSRVWGADAADTATVHRLAQKAAGQARSDPDLTLAKPGSRTSEGPIDDGPTRFDATPKAVRYAIWRGSRVWTGDWSRSECGPTGDTSGIFGDRWQSFEPVPLRGAFNCDEPTTSLDLRKPQKQACAVYD